MIRQLKSWSAFVLLLSKVVDDVCDYPFKSIQFDGNHDDYYDGDQDDKEELIMIKWYNWEKQIN